MEYHLPGQTAPSWRHIVHDPVTLMEPEPKWGVDDSWSLVHAADKLWNGQEGPLAPGGLLGRTPV